MNDKTFTGVIVALVVIAIGAIVVFGGGNSSGAAFIGDPLEVQTGQSTNEEGETQPNDHVLGAGTAGVTLIEYGDFGCSACFGFYPELQQIKEEFGDKISIVYRHNPLSQIHPNAFAAHRASVAADKQGQFWPMHDLLYENWASWSAQGSGLAISEAAAVIEGFAQQLGLDMAQYEADLSSQETFNYIDSHLDSGAQLDVTGTPTIFLNGEIIDVRRATEFIPIIQDLIDTIENESSDESGEEATKPEDEEDSSDEE